MSFWSIGLLGFREDRSGSKGFKVFGLGLRV